MKEDFNNDDFAFIGNHNCIFKLFEIAIIQNAFIDARKLLDEEQGNIAKKFHDKILQKIDNLNDARKKIFNEDIMLDDYDLLNIKDQFERAYTVAEPEDIDEPRFLNYKNRYDKLLLKINKLNDWYKETHLEKVESEFEEVEEEFKEVEE